MAGRPSPRRVTLDDVARRAGVSKATVSKALNGRDDIAPDTRDRVLATVEAMGYRATTDRGRPAAERAVVAVLDVLESPYMTHVLGGILAATTAADTDLLVRLAPDRDARTTRAAARAWVARQRAAGAVGVVGLTLAQPDALLLAAQEAGLPFVMVDPVDTQEARVVSIGATNWAGGRTATEHLLGLGHRRIAWIGGPAGSTAARERLHGYRAALDSAGVPPDPALVRSDEFAVETGTRHARELLRLPDPPTAVVAGDDEIAVGVLTAAHELDVPVPGRLSVVGYDDTPQAGWTSPRLTSVHQPLDGMGRMAVETVLGMASGVEPASWSVQLATTLVVRESTAPPA
ncbi:LacI family DNA-binding transcriptional regulator [Cellulomonas sp. S1-8]|uniref:LacI family DNA-binding transcriptional regulator n=1 Tax=Cellulomonas sp. S1-8 TaxID=2904790 RepID=UPI002243D4E3|nr:LacI family DNA-binding transcriptional regulator [Cellulomonas sp. S1-8]UZN04225.1 LacI family DNA-binding transcriptional regulator [Cellulomonas sp. S1-8]